MKKSLSYGFLLILLMLALFTSHCKKENGPLPFAVVNISIEPNSTQFINLNAVGGHEYITANPPSRGIIVYRLSVNDFMAFERTCPYDPDGCCTTSSCTRLVVEDDGIIVTDSCCGSTYLILDGSNVTGPSVTPLKQYNTTYNGKTLHIYN
jgi:hypothetical protein